MPPENSRFDAQPEPKTAEQIFLDKLNTFSQFDNLSPERFKILGQAPHCQVLLSCKANLEKFGASTQEIIAILSPRARDLGYRYLEIVDQTTLLKGAAQNLAQLKLDREVAPHLDNWAEAQLAELNAIYRNDLINSVTDGAENLAITV